MNIVKYYLAVILLMLALCRCEEESFVEIDSLSAMGDEFFFGQKVKVWMAIKTDDLGAARYTWSCDAGRFTQPQGLDENTWEAPRAPGTYTVTCTVDVNGTKQTRSRKLLVSTYYFEKFERNAHTFTGTNSSMSVKNGHLEVRVNSTTEPRGYIQHAFADPSLKPPLSCVAEVGWISNFPTDAIKVGPSVTENTLQYEWTVTRDTDKEDNIYIDNLRFDWYPAGKTSGLPNGNGIFTFRQKNAWNNVTLDHVRYINHPALTFAKAENKKVSLTIDVNYTIHIMLNGEEIFSTDAIQVWRTNNGSKDDIFINQWRINYCSNSAGKTAPTIYVDETYAVNDGAILK